MASAWKTPAFRGSHFFDSIASAEGLNVGDPAALARIRDAITDAQVWLYQQHTWWWAVSPNSPARFEVFPTTNVIVASTGTTLSVSDTGEFQIGDTIVIAEGLSKQELSEVSAVTARVSLTVAATLVNSHSLAENATVRKLRPVVFDPSVRTRLDAPSLANDTDLNVGFTAGFAVNDLVVIDPGGANQEIHKLATVVDVLGLTLYGNQKFAHASGTNVYKVTESCPRFDLTLVNGGVMADFGRAIKVLVLGEGPLFPMNPADWRRSREDSVEGGISQGDRYIIEGSPPEMRFEVTPTSNKTVVVHYLRAPTRVFGDDDIQVPYEFHNLLRWLARAFLRKNGPAGGTLTQDPDILAEINRLKGYDLDTSQRSGMRPMGGRFGPELDAVIPGAAVRSSRFEDLLN